MPFMYPTRTGFESRSVTKPTFAMPATTQKSPVSRASIEPNAMARASSPGAIDHTTAPMSATKPESGPSTSTREGPNTAYASNGTMDA
jgi:hypothetical protein